MRSARFRKTKWPNYIVNIIVKTSAAKKLLTLASILWSYGAWECVSPMIVWRAWTCFISLVVGMVIRCNKTQPNESKCSKKSHPRTIPQQSKTLIVVWPRKNRCSLWQYKRVKRWMFCRKWLKALSVQKSFTREQRLWICPQLYQERWWWKTSRWSFLKLLS